VENTWFVTDSGVQALSAKIDGVAGSRHVVTAIYAGYDDSTKTGTLTVSNSSAAVLTLPFTGQIELTGICIEFDMAEDVEIAITAGGASINGAVLMCGYTK
jgi:hypothetical protein